jgi:hypothetical protein
MVVAVAVVARAKAVDGAAKALFELSGAQAEHTQILAQPMPHKK